MDRVEVFLETDGIDIQVFNQDLPQLPLFFEFDARGQDMTLGLHVVEESASPYQLRTTAFASLKRHGFAGCAGRLNNGSTRVYRRQIFSKNEAEQRNWSDVHALACERVQGFLNEDYPAIDELIKSIQWPRAA